MFLLKITLWLSIYFIFFILFSMNTLISVFCFILIIILIAFLLLQLHIEYVTFLILLLYLGGILIFFLFTVLMLNNENTVLIKTSGYYSCENLLLLLLSCKTFFFISYFNSRICFFLQNWNNTEYSPFLIINNYFLKNFLKNQGDIISFVSLYTEQFLLLLILGMILLFTMMGVIIITKTKYV